MSTTKRKTISLRTPETEALYGAYKASSVPVDFLKEPVIQRFLYWRIIENSFPYDLAFTTHHLLIPNRLVASRKDLLQHEIDELDVLMELDLDYDCMMENFPRNRTVPGHFHIHLLNYKELAQ